MMYMSRKYKKKYQSTILFITTCKNEFRVATFNSGVHGDEIEICITVVVLEGVIFWSFFLIKRDLWAILLT